MGALKLTGIIAVFICSSAVGIIAAGRLRERLKMLRALRVMLGDISVLIRCKAVPLPELINELRKNPALAPLTFLDEIGEKMSFSAGQSFGEVWRSAAESFSAKAEDKEFLYEIGAFLGKSDIAGQLSSAELYCRRTEEKIASAEREYSEKSRLYPSLGVLSGAFIAVILI